MQSEYDIDLAPIRDYLNSISKCQASQVQIFPMIDENIYVTYCGCDANRNLQFYIVLINPEREFEVFIADPYTTWLSHTIEPTTKTPASLCSKRESGYDYYWISAQTFDSNYICISPSQNSWAFQPTEIAFDKYGNLYILANQNHFCVPANQKKYCLWKFAPGETIWLDPNNSNSLTPGGVGGIAYELYISGDGGMHYIGTSAIYPSPETDLAISCDGATYNSVYGRHLKGYYSDERQFVINNYGYIDDVKLNEYGEIFLLMYPSKIHIVMADELPEGWYLCQLCKYPGESRSNTRAKGPNCEPGEGEIILKLDRDQGSSNDSVITLDKSNTSASILFGERPKINAYWKDENAQESPLSVKWELTGKTITGNISDKSLFKNTPVLLFTGGQSPYNSQFLDFQTVHTGKINLKVTSATQDKEGTLEVKININTPSRLGNAPNNFDEKIIQYANKYGIPPQYLKSQVNKEAKIKCNEYIPNSFRYEPIGWDYGTTIEKGIYEWTENDWTDRKTDYWSFNYPNGTNLSSTILELIGNFYKIVSIEEDPKNPDKPKYTCKKYKYLNNFATIYDVYNANNGWGSGSYPNKLYKRMGPCGVRENWDIHAFGEGNYVAYHNYKYYCGTDKEKLKGCSNAQLEFIEFLYNKASAYWAQIPIGSSYGLMQMMYIIATDDYEWKKNESANQREPSLLFDPDESLDVGSRYDAIKMKKRKIENSKNIDEFLEVLKEGFNDYNRKYRKKDYGAPIISNAKNFKPY